MAEPTHPGLVPGPHWQTGAGEHPSEAAWERLACGELPSAERRVLVDHVVGCAECTRIYRALAALEEGARRFDPDVPEPRLAQPARSGRRAGRWGLGALVAAATLVLWIGVRPAAPPAPPEETLRSSPRGTALPVLRAPLGAVAAPEAFAWEPVPGAVRYRLELLDAEGEIVWSAATVETSAAWPAGLPARPGRHYWRVVAELERGGSVASALADFDIIAPAAGRQ